MHGTTTITTTTTKPQPVKLYKYTVYICITI